MSYELIENHAVIGNLHTVALVGTDGSIDFMCAPRFDSPSVFCGLLDDRRGGKFQIAPRLTDERRRQVYLPDTNILLTRFLAEEGVAEVSDFMPIRKLGHPHAVVRRAKTVRGVVAYRMVCAPRFDYGRATHRIEAKEREVLFVSEGSERLAFRLRSSHPLKVKGPDVVAEFELTGEQSASFVFEHVQELESSPCGAEAYVANAFKETMNYWRGWVAASRYQGRWRETVNRSALTLKMLTSQDHGSMVAAPTFGLPEAIGGDRNWDYRYTWIRDSSFTLYALMRLGYAEEAKAFMRWVEARCYELRPEGSLQIMYGIDGRHDLAEQTVPSLEGYCGSSPVRIGNGAYTQKQLDIYGELLDSVYLFNKYDPISHDLWTQLRRLLDWVCEHWREQDEGIWEVRGRPRAFLYSRLMCWVALDRGVRLAQKRSFPAPLARWLDVRDTIYCEIIERFWNPDRKAFVQYDGGRSLDASALLLPLVRFIGPSDPRWLSTLRAIEHDLVGDSLVERYRSSGANDGMKGKEGTFNMCSFWYVECLSRAGDPVQARFLFEKMLGYANHVGLYAEELGPQGHHLGNFPQAFTHLALISAAYDIDRRLSQGRILNSESDLSTPAEEPRP